jgi:hypothetical protein
LYNYQTFRPIIVLGTGPTPVVPLRGRFGLKLIFCEAELRFLLLFLEKEEFDLTGSPVKLGLLLTLFASFSGKRRI